MFDLAVKYTGFLKHVPVVPHAFDGLLKISKLITNPEVLDYIDEIEKELLSWDGVEVSAHKFGGLQFDLNGKEIGHIHGNGLLDILFSRKIKEQLIEEGRAKEHHVFKNSGWISFAVKDETGKNNAIELLRLSYSGIRKDKTKEKNPIEKTEARTRDVLRICFLFFSWLITSFILTKYSALLVDFIGPTSFGREFMICGGQIVFQSLLLFIAKQKPPLLLNYLTQMMMVSLIGSALLIPAFGINHLFKNLPEFFFPAWFMLVVAFMLFEHVRRVKKVSAPKWLSPTWVIYRIIVLVILLAS
jgi:hypothetical protein